MKKLCLLPCLLPGLSLTVDAAEPKEVSSDKAFRYSSTVEEERPQLDVITRRLIAAYQKNPTDGNRLALRRQVAVNYDKVLARKRAKLAELQ